MSFPGDELVKWIRPQFFFFIMETIFEWQQLLGQSNGSSETKYEIIISQMLGGYKAQLLPRTGGWPSFLAERQAGSTINSSA